jgi:DNA-directed RNA polymerase specialized sigma24 family protein
MEHVITNAMATGELPAPTVSDAGGVEEWMRLYRGRVFRYILFATRDEDVAESLTQDC